MKAGYADPPYLGQAKKHYHCDEIDHAKLITELTDKYECWALSCNSPSLRIILSLCPVNVRVLAWVKPFAIYKPNVNPAYAWEPVILYGERKKRDRKTPTIRDWHSCNITLKKGLVGAKPETFCYWIFDVMGLTPHDQLDDIFPGTGAVMVAWNKWRAHHCPNFKDGGECKYGAAAEHCKVYYGGYLCGILQNDNTSDKTGSHEPRLEKRVA